MEMRFSYLRELGAPLVDLEKGWCLLCVITYTHDGTGEKVVRSGSTTEEGAVRSDPTAEAHISVAAASTTEIT